ncbi:SDR family NAD(P)-dependent oxidoreductase [Arsenicicoccus dermatophilus]|uniref:SDR family NAD(P)-dependent oxidoreductase n=1 Tax=Arsenicicoccus dermatophilus TaxID=1076331 RepID=UPI001F4CE229|nr:SDR family oxidoreductase [Arsenicicoccus dermatophilus]MCH8613192.1 SDR family oxidoreductase [Arsenicicoccus dermatophilus]
MTVPTRPAGAPGARPVALVTGASRGIGAHLARGFAQAGYAVELTSRDGIGARRVADELSAAGLDATGSPLDVVHRDQVEVLLAEVLERHGRVDVLVNNAGVIEPPRLLWEADVDEWWAVQQTNVLGPFLLSRAVVPVMIAGGGGRVIDVNSGSGTRADGLQSAYHVSKTALARITGAIHLAGAEHGVRAFDLAPGVVRTDMTAAMPQHEGREEWTDLQDVVELALALASGELDAWSGRMVRAGADTPQSLAVRAARGLDDRARTIGLIGYGEGDPVTG